MKKIIFDLDNTLLVISKEWEKTYQDFINKYKLNTSPEELYKYFGISKSVNDVVVTNEFFCKYLKENTPINITEEMLIEFLHSYANIPLLNLDLVSDVLTYLSQKYELIVYSNWFTFNQIERLKKNNLDHFFSKIYGWDVLPIKPSKKGIDAIVKSNNIKDYIFIGDNIEEDLEIPDSMGMETIFYNSKQIKQQKYKEIYNIEELKKML